MEGLKREIKRLKEEIEEWRHRCTAGVATSVAAPVATEVRSLALQTSVSSSSSSSAMRQRKRTRRLIAVEHCLHLQRCCSNTSPLPQNVSRQQTTSVATVLLSD